MTATYRRIILLCILIVAAALRLWQLPTLPPGFHLDESFQSLEAWRILADPTYRPIYLTGNFGVPPLNAYANALMFHLFMRFGGEPGPLAMHTTSVCFGLLTILAVYALATELRRFEPGGIQLSPAFPLFAAGTLAVMRWHIHFSRMGIESILVPLVWTTATGLLLHGWRTGRWVSFVGSGFLVGVGMYTYRGAWVIPFLFILVVAILLIERWWRGQLAKQHVVGVLLCAVIAFLIFAPLGLLFLREPQLILLRLNQIAIIGETGSPADDSVWNNLWTMSKMFGPFGTPGDADPRRNLPGAPALNLWLAFPFYLGFGLALWRIRRPAYAACVIGLVGLLSVNVFSEYAPHFHRILGATAPTALLCGIGLDSLWRWQLLRNVRLYWLSIVLLLLGAGTDARDYFVRWANLPDLYYAFDVGLWQIGRETAAQPADTTVYLTPRSLAHPTLAFAWEAVAQRTDRPVTFDGRHVFPTMDQAQSRAELYAVIEHEDFRTPLLLPEVLPDAVIQQELTDDQGQIYARYYVRPPQTVAARPPQHPIQVELGDGITLVGYDVQPPIPQPGEILYLQLHWRVTAQPTTNWTVFTHVRMRDTTDNTVRVAGQDNLPGAGSLPTPNWQPGWRVLDEYQIRLPTELAPGTYTLATGLYESTGERLPDDEQGVVLGTVEIR